MPCSIHLNYFRPSQARGENVFPPPELGEKTVKILLAVAKSDSYALWKNQITLPTPHKKMCENSPNGQHMAAPFGLPSGNTYAFLPLVKEISGTWSITENTVLENWDIKCLVIDGPCIKVTNGAKLQITRSTLNGYHTSVMCLDIQGSELLLDDVTIQNFGDLGNIGDIGGIHNVQASKVVIKNSVFKNNIGRVVGAIFTHSAALSIYQTTFQNNTNSEGKYATSWSAAALSVNYVPSELILEDTNFIGNKDVKSTEAGIITIYNNAGAVIKGSTFQDNEVSSGGSVLRFLCPGAVGFTHLSATDIGSNKILCE